MPTTPEDQWAGSGTVLLVDDEDDVRRALRRLLRGHCRTVEASSGEEAIRLLEQEPAEVVVSDYRMPGMSGVELLQIVKDRWPRIQRVLLTGQADTGLIESAVNRAEVFRFIWKPWEGPQVVHAIRGARDQHRLLDENARLADLLSERNRQLEELNRALDSELATRTRALVLAADEWRACFDAIGDPLAILKPGGEILRANASFAALAGVPVKSLNKGLKPDEGGFGRIPWPVADGDAPEGANLTEASRAGRTWQVSAFPFPEAGVVAVWKDVTEERDVSRRLMHTEKMAAVGQLAGGVAHEINNPLGGILAFAQIMSREERSGEDREHLNLIIDAATRARRIVESLLRFSRRNHEVVRRDVDLSRVADDALLLVSAQLRDGTVELARDLAPAWCVGSADQLGQVAVNLLVNALQAAGDRGMVRVETEVAGGRARLRVTDDGPGVPQALVSRIFEPFFTTKPEGQGTGLGLSICYRIAEEHGGSVRHERPPEGGASFVLEIPAGSPRP